MRQRRCLLWLRVLGVEPSARLIGALADLGAYYNGRGWLRLTGGDIPVRELLADHGREYATGKPPVDLTAPLTGAVRVAGLSSYVVVDD